MRITSFFIAQVQLVESLFLGYEPNPGKEELSESSPHCGIAHHPPSVRLLLGIGHSGLGWVQTAVRFFGICLHPADAGIEMGLVDCCA